MRITVPVVIEMTDEQTAAYVSEAGLPRHDGPLRARDIVDDVRRYVLTAIQDSPELGDADVSIKR